LFGKIVEGGACVFFGGGGSVERVYGIDATKMTRVNIIIKTWI